MHYPGTCSDSENMQLQLSSYNTDTDDTDHDSHTSLAHTLALALLKLKWSITKCGHKHTYFSDHFISFLLNINNYKKCIWKLKRK